MKYLGVVYDVGIHFAPDTPSVDPWREDLVDIDLGVIALEMGANAVRVQGQSLERLEYAAGVARDLGLTVFFNPWLMDGSPQAIEEYLSDAADAAERLRSTGADIVFVVGCELSIFSQGIIPGESFGERLPQLGAMIVAAGGTSPTLPELSGALNAVLARYVAAVRPRFGGQVTYSAGSWEEVNWDPFDFVGIDHYRQGETTDEQYVNDLVSRRRPGKDIVVMEVGCCAYTGAALLGGGGFMVYQGLNANGNPIWMNDTVPERNEAEQAEYIRRQLHALDGTADGVFVYVFSYPSMPVDEGAADLDMACYSLVKTFPAHDERSRHKPPWERKEAFFAARDALQTIASEGSLVARTADGGAQ